VPLLAAALGRPPGADLEPAERSGMVELDGGVVRFTHPLFATAIYTSATTERRRRLHRRLAAAVDDAEHQARHLALAAEGPDERVAAALERAARAVGRRGVATAAAELAEQAHGLTPPRATAQLRTRGMLAAECHLVAGDLGRAHALLEEVVAAAPPGAARAPALVLLGQVRYHQDSFPDAAGLFAQAREEAAGDRRLLGLIEGQLSFAVVSAGDLEGAAVHATRALELLEEQGPPAVLAEAIRPGYQALVFVGAYGSLRIGELVLHLRAPGCPTDPVFRSPAGGRSEWPRSAGHGGSGRSSHTTGRVLDPA
jgi:tetratricopeptide (TPR) repeat protein